MSWTAAAGSTSRLMLGALLVLAAGCQTAAEPGESRVRIRNSTAFAVDSVRLGFPAGSVGTGALQPGQASPYVRQVHPYRYGALNVYAGTTVLSLVPIDYVGESPLSPGTYTFVITAATPEQHALDLQVVRDP